VDVPLKYCRVKDWVCAVTRVILAPFKKFKAEGEVIGRLLAGYSNLEVGLMHCVQMAGGGTLDSVLRKMFRIRSESKRIKEAESVGLQHYGKQRLVGHFRKAIEAMRHCLAIRNQYAHHIWWDDYSGKLAFANLEELAHKPHVVIKDLGDLTAFHVDQTLLESQEAYFVYVDEYLAWINYEGRARLGKIPRNMLDLPKRPPKPRLQRK
jgi:hypothetical protein